MVPPGGLLLIVIAVLVPAPLSLFFFFRRSSRFVPAAQLRTPGFSYFPWHCGNQPFLPEPYQILSGTSGFFTHVGRVPRSFFSQDDRLVSGISRFIPGCPTFSFPEQDVMKAFYLKCSPFIARRPPHRAFCGSRSRWSMVLWRNFEVAASTPWSGRAVDRRSAESRRVSQREVIFSFPSGETWPFSRLTTLAILKGYLLYAKGSSCLQQSLEYRPVPWPSGRALPFPPGRIHFLRGTPALSFPGHAGPLIGQFGSFSFRSDVVTCFFFEILQDFPQPGAGEHCFFPTSLRILLTASPGTVFLWRL